MARSRQNIALRCGHHQSGRNIKMYGIFKYWYATLLTAFATSLRLGEFMRPGASQRTCSMYHRQAGSRPASPAASSTKATVSHKKNGLANSTGHSKPTAAISTASKARQANVHKTKEPQLMQLARTLKKRTVS